MKKTLLLTLLALLGMTQAMAQEAGYLPIAREGVKWVNEKVIVDHGDTTCYYYNYQIYGNDSTWSDMKDCYYFTSDELDVNNDSLIATLSSNQTITFFRTNEALSKARGEERLLLVIGNFNGLGFLYVFNDNPPSPTSIFSNTIKYYLFCQEISPPDTTFSLTCENFIIIEPIDIEGFSCSRWALLGEDSDTLAYLVEGIGFDSRDMGDLLTPFMRPVDRTADHQEWCGLSHVVKDGKIIYKGMRYREGAFDGIDEAVADRTVRPADPHYYDLMGRPVGTDVPTAPGIYIHQGKKIIVMQ